MLENEIVGSKYPDWLRDLENELPNFNIKQILEDSFYYPACGVDIEPIFYYFPKYFYSFIYCDYTIKKGELRRCFICKIEKRFKLLHKISIPLSVIPLASSKNIDEFMHMKNPNISYMKEPVAESYSEWYIFYDQQSNKYLSLLFICSEGQMVFEELYVKNKIAPKVLAYIFTGKGFGQNYNSFEDDIENIIERNNLKPHFLCNKIDSNIDDCFEINDKKQMLFKKVPKRELILNISDYNDYIKSKRNW